MSLPPSGTAMSTGQQKLPRKFGRNSDRVHGSEIAGLVKELVKNFSLVKVVTHSQDGDMKSRHDLLCVYRPSLVDASRLPYSSVNGRQCRYSWLLIVNACVFTSISLTKRF